MYQITKPVLRSCWSLTRIWGAECHWRFILSISTSTSSCQTLKQWVMSMEKDSTKTLQRWRAIIKANGTPAWWETSAGCSCMTSRRQNTPDLLRKHTFDCLWYYELYHPSILIQSVFFIYPDLSVKSCCSSWNMHIYSLFILKWDYLKPRELEVIKQNYLWFWIQHTQIKKKKPIPILASEQKFIFVNQCYYFI